VTSGKLCAECRLQSRGGATF